MTIFVFAMLWLAIGFTTAYALHKYEPEVDMPLFIVIVFTLGGLLTTAIAVYDAVCTSKIWEKPFFKGKKK